MTAYSQNTNDVHHRKKKKKHTLLQWRWWFYLIFCIHFSHTHYLAILIINGSRQCKYYTHYTVHVVRDLLYITLTVFECFLYAILVPKLFWYQTSKTKWIKRRKKNVFETDFGNSNQKNSACANVCVCVFFSPSTTIIVTASLCNLRLYFPINK